MVCDRTNQTSLGGVRLEHRPRLAPIGPAEGEFPPLFGRQASHARQKAAPMLPDDLEAAISPAVALLLERLEAVGQQAVTVAAQQAAQLFAEAAGLLLVGDTETRIGYLQKVADAFYCQRDVVRTLYVSA